jgi:hypothetical protein
MSTTTMASRGLAIAAGLAFTGGALCILLEDAIKNHHWTMAHGLAILTVFGVIASGHLAKEAMKHRHVGAALGFFLVAIVGTALVVYQSVGRQAEANDTSVLSAEDRNASRAETRTILAKNQQMLDEERSKHSSECGSGRGK